RSMALSFTTLPLSHSATSFVYHQVVAVGVAGEVAVDDSGAEDVLVLALTLESLEDGHDLVVEELLIVEVGEGALLHLPLAAEEGDGIDEGVDVIEIDAGYYLRAPEGRRGDLVVGEDGGVGARGWCDGDPRAGRDARATGGGAFELSLALGS